MGSFEKPYPQDREKRMKAFAHDGVSKWDDRLGALTCSVDDGAVQPAMIAYAGRLELLR